MQTYGKKYEHENNWCIIIQIGAFKCEKQIETIANSQTETFYN